MNERLGYTHPDFREWKNRPPFQCSIHMGKYSVNIFSNMSNFLPHFEGSKAEYLTSFPGWRVTRHPTDSRYSIIYSPNPQSAFFYDEETKTLTASGKPEDYKSGQVLAYLGFWLMETQRQAESMFTIHSSAIAIKDKGVLLLGHAGAGKTSILLGLGNKFDGEVISNDLTIVAHNPDQESLTLVDGTKDIRLRLASIRLRFPQLATLFSSCDQPPWEAKIVVKPGEIGMREAAEPKILKTAFIVHLDTDESEPLLVSKVGGIPIRFTLYEDMSRIVRGNAISLFGVDDKILGYIPSLDNPELHTKRVAAIECLVEKIGIWSVSGGNLDQICKEINQLTPT